MQQRREIEAERHGRILRGTADAEGEQLVSHPVGHGQQPVGAPGESALDGPVDGGLGRREVAAQHVAVEGVHDDRHAAEKRGQPAHRAGLGGVRMDDRRLHAPYQPHQRPQCPQVAQRPDLTAEIGDDPDRRVAPVQRQVVALGGVFGAGHQCGGEARRIEPGREERGVDGRAADVEAGDDAQDADGGTRYDRRHEPATAPIILRIAAS